MPCKKISGMWQLCRFLLFFSIFISLSKHWFMLKLYFSRSKKISLDLYCSCLHFRTSSTQLSTWSFNGTSVERTSHSWWKTQCFWLVFIWVNYTFLNWNTVKHGKNQTLMATVVACLAKLNNVTFWWCTVSIVNHFLARRRIAPCLDW